jgi:hypothetical protein
MSDDRDLSWNANRLGGEVTLQFVYPGNGLALKLNDNVPLSQTGTGCGTAWLDAGDPYPVIIIHIPILGD